MSNFLCRCHINKRMIKPFAFTPFLVILFFAFSILPLSPAGNQVAPAQADIGIGEIIDPNTVIISNHYTTGAAFDFTQGKIFTLWHDYTEYSDDLEFAGDSLRGRMINMGNVPLDSLTIPPESGYDVDYEFGQKAVKGDAYWLETSQDEYYKFYIQDIDDTPDIYGNLTSLTFIYEKYSASAEPSLISIAVDPSNVTLSPGAKKQLKVTAEYSDGTTEDVTADAVYEPDDYDVAEVSDTGLISIPATAEDNAGTTIYVSYDDFTAECVITVKKVAAVKSIAASVKSITLSSKHPKNTRQLKITATMLDKKKQDVTVSAVYISSNPNAVTVSESGLITVVPGTAKGTTVNITVTYGDKSCVVKVKTK